MKLFKKISCIGLIALVVFNSGCKKLLEEHPRASIVPSFFNTPEGILGGISAVYNDIRGAWGTEGFTLQSYGGTDETLQGASNTASNFYTYNGITTGAFNNSWWNTAFQDINTLNGVLEFGQTVNLPTATRAQYIAQAKFLRAFWYYHLVITFGDVPLHTAFITTPSSADTRAPIADVYTQIIKDLTEAAADLPNVPTTPFLGKAACKPVALFLLAKTYLARGWSAATQPTDFQNAYTTCQGLITNKTTYGLDLWADYADAFKPGPLSINTNDYGKETIFVSDHSIDAKYGQYTVGGQLAGGGAQNITCWFYRWNYPTTALINTFKNGSGNLVGSGSSMMIRDIINGRPFIRVRPNAYYWPSGAHANQSYVYEQAFSSRTNDSRYDKTFQTVWIVNTPISNTVAAANNTRGIGYTMNVNVDTAFWFADNEVTGAPQFNGAIPFKGVIVTPKTQNNTIYPCVKKFDDPFRTVINDPSTRPVVLWRFSDVYLMAAEAAFKGGGTMQQAADMLNVVRQRAAFRTTNTAPQNAAAVVAQTITPAQVTLDFILDERSREFYGEAMRWWDLVRTQSLVRRVTEWNPEAAPYIKSFHVLRPIPQDQIDRVTEGPAFPQNLGY
jgi:hypothetical protein